MASLATATVGGMMERWAKYEKLQNDVDSLRYLLALEFHQNLELLRFYEKTVKKLRSQKQQCNSKAPAESVNVLPSFEIVGSVSVDVLELVLGASSSAARTLREELRSALSPSGDEDPCGFVRMVENIKKVTGADDFDGMEATEAIYTMTKTLISAQKDKEAAALLAEGKGFRPDRLNIDWYLHVNPGTGVMNLRFLMKQLLKVVSTQIKRDEMTRNRLPSWANWLVGTLFTGICNCQKQECCDSHSEADWRRRSEIGVGGKWEIEEVETEHQDTARTSSTSPEP